MKNSLNRRSLDNVTVVVIAFSGFRDIIESLNSQHFNKENMNLLQRPDKRMALQTAGVKSQRSSSHSQALGNSRGFLAHKNLM